MYDVLEIFAAVLAAIGIASLLEKLRLLLLYPYKLRRRLRLAVIYNENENMTYELISYVKYLSREHKISDGRLIIITKDDIINGIPESMLNDSEIVKCREDTANGAD